MARPQKSPRRRRKRSWLTRTLLWCAAVLVVLLVATVIATPWILRAAVPEAFARFGLQASVHGGTLNPLRREVTLKGFTLGAPDAPALSLGELGIGLGVRELVQGRIKLRHIRVADVTLNADRLLELRHDLDTGSKSTGKSLPVELDELVLVDVRLSSLGERIGHDVRVDRLEVRDPSALLDGRPSSAELKGVVGDGELDLKADITLEHDDVRAAGTYHLSRMPVAGWTRLANGIADPIGGGTVNGRGDIRLSYGIGTERLAVTLDGRLAVAALDVALEPVTAENGGASWQGRLELAWSPQSPFELRGEGSLDMEKARLGTRGESMPPLRAMVTDVSWQGDFDSRGGFTSRGAVLGTSLEIADATGPAPAWRLRGEDFSAKVRTRMADGSGGPEVRTEDFDLARLTVTSRVDDGPVQVTVEKVNFDELRTAGSGDVVLGVASVDSLAVSAGTDAQAMTLRTDALTAKGLSGDLSGKLHVAHMGAGSMDLERNQQRVRVDEVALASVGFGVPSWVGADELRVKSVRAQDGEADVWISDVEANRLHGDASGRFDAETIQVGHMFQTGSAALSWDASTLKLQRLHGDIDDAGTVDAADLEGLKIDVGETSLTLAGLRARKLTMARDGDARAARIDLAKLDGRLAGAGKLRVHALGAEDLRVRDAHGALEGLEATRVEYDTPAGDAFDTRGLEARNLSGDLTKGLKAKRFMVARGSGRLAAGARLDTRTFAVQGLEVGADGALSADEAKLASFSQTTADAGALEIQDAVVAKLRREARGSVGAETGQVGTIRYTGDDATRWGLTGFGAGSFTWDGQDRVDLARATLESASQFHGETRDWQSRDLRVAGLRLVLPDGLNVDTLGAKSVKGGADSPGWQVDTVEARDIASSDRDGQTVGSVTTGTVEVTDARNKAAVNLDRVAVKGVAITPSRAYSVGGLLLASLRVRSADPKWPSRVSVSELRASGLSLGADGAIDLGRVVARNPYVIAALSKDNVWMWPPLPGEETGKKPPGPRPVIRLESFTTSGPARVAFIDQATNPAFHMTMDPLVVALENLDTGLPGNVSRFRARGTGPRYSEIRARGELRTAVAGMDLKLHLETLGADVEILNPYVALHEPITVTAGRADTRGDMTIENDELTGRVHLLVSGLELESAMGGRLFEAIDPANFPIRTALALLKDRNGDISVDIPLESNTAAPAYDFVDDFQKDFIRTVTAAGKATANLPGKTLDRAISLIERTVSLLPGIDATRYGPIAFPAGSDALTARPIVYLDQLGARMTRHESLTLAVCGRAVEADEKAVSAPTAGIETLFAEASVGVYPTFGPGHQEMLALAHGRADAVRRYLQVIHRIAEPRLVDCDPTLDEAAGAKPRVDLVVKTPAGRNTLFGILP